MKIPCPLCADDHDEPANVCPGPCNRAWVAAERHATPTAPNILQPNPGQPLWCPDCRELITTVLRCLPDLAAQLGSGPLATPSTDVGRLSKADVHLSPSPSWDLYDEVARWAMDVEDWLRERLGHPAIPAHEFRYLPRTVGYLAGHLSPLLCADPHGVAFGAETLAWERRLTWATSTGRAGTERVAGACRGCTRRGQLRREDPSSTWLACGACGLHYDEAAQEAG